MALTSVVQWVGRHPVKQKVAVGLLVRARASIVGLVTGRDMCERQQIEVSLSQ